MGIVKTHAHKIFVVTPQRTADTRCDAPTPMMADEMTCVVDNGAPNVAATMMVVAAESSAAKPWMGFKSMILLPMVLMILTPPAAVPSAIAVAHASTTQSGGWSPLV